MTTSTGSAHVCTNQGAGTSSQLNAEIHEIVQAAAVSKPVIRGSVRITGLVIQHDDIKLRITPKTHVASVLIREFPLKSERAQASFVVDFIPTERADWFVVAVQRDIATIVQALQDHGQQVAANFTEHKDAPDYKGAVIFCLPGGAGKSYLAPMLAVQLGIPPHTIIDEWRPGADIKPGALHVTNSIPSNVPQGVTLIYGERG